MKMNRMTVLTVFGLSVGIPLLSGCFSNGAANFDPKCNSFREASVVKTYYIEQVEVDGVPSLWSVLTNPREKKTEGKTFITGNDIGRGRKFVNWLDAHGPFERNFTTNRAEGEPLSIKVVVSKTNTNGGVAKCNNFLAFFTLNIWPWYHSWSFDYNVEVKSPNGIKSEQFGLQERSLTSWLPLALCPVPAWADYRDMTDNPVEESLEAEQVGRCIISLLAEKADSK